MIHPGRKSLISRQVQATLRTGRRPFGEYCLLHGISMSERPLFSVIVTDYEPSINRSDFRRKMTCLASQTCKDFEVLVYHDGPKPTPYADEIAGLAIHGDTKFITTEVRANDWGHSNRDLGIREATGTWIIHTNADNVFFPQLIERLKEKVETPSFAMRENMRFQRRPIRGILKRFDRIFGTTYSRKKFEPSSEKEILIFGILMRGLVATASGYKRFPETAHHNALIFGGIPVKFGQIDAMQFVMRRDLWLKVGGWYDRREESDGYMFEKLTKRFVVTAVPEILGEHW